MREIDKTIRNIPNRNGWFAFNFITTPIPVLCLAELHFAARLPFPRLGSIGLAATVLPTKSEDSVVAGTALALPQAPHPRHQFRLRPTAPASPPKAPGDTCSSCVSVRLQRPPGHPA